MKLLALTGGIGSGKSTVTSLFQKQGADIIDADRIVHMLQARGTPLLQEIVEHFGPGVLTPEQELDRKALGRIVFQDPEKRDLLNSLVHPKVIQEMTRQIQAAHEAGAEILILDIPLLFEGQQSGKGSASVMPYAATILVYAPEETQISRTMARDACTREEAEERIRAQLSIEEKRALADHIIDNSGTPEALEPQVKALWQEFTRN